MLWEFRGGRGKLRPITSGNDTRGMGEMRARRDRGRCLIQGNRHWFDTRMARCFRYEVPLARKTAFAILYVGIGMNKIVMMNRRVQWLQMLRGETIFVTLREEEC